MMAQDRIKAQDKIMAQNKIMAQDKINGPIHQKIKSKAQDVKWSRGASNVFKGGPTSG